MATDLELEAFKALSLVAVAAAHGYILSQRESSPGSKTLRNDNGDKIVVSPAPDGHDVFFSVRTAHSGSVIDFVMYQRKCNLGHARKFLRGMLASSPNTSFFPTAPNDVSNRSQALVSEIDRTALLHRWRDFRGYFGSYLASRVLSHETVALFSARIRMDQRDNVAFRHDDLQGITGWELKNAGFRGFSPGGKKGLFAGRVGLEKGERPMRVVIAESALDAMSFYQLHPLPGLYLSFAGAISRCQRQLLADILARYPSAAIIAATDADSAGDEFASLIASMRPEAVRARPNRGKDWNDVLVEAIRFRADSCCDCG